MPTIDISQLAPLDEAGFARRGSAPEWERGSIDEVVPAQRPAYAPAAYASAPAHAAAARAFEPPPDAFAPPSSFGTGREPLGVERSTRAIRIENELHRQLEAELSASSRLPSVSSTAAAGPRSSSIGLVVAVLLIVAVAIGILLIVLR